MKHFETLGLQEGATQEDIQAAYERLSKELNPSNNDNQEFFVEEYKKVQEAYKALHNTSILTNSTTSSTSSSPNQRETPSSNSSGSFTVTISPEKIEELKNKAHETKNQPRVKPSMFQSPFSFKGRIRRMEHGLSFIIWNIYIIIAVGISAASNNEVISYLLMVPGYWFLLAQGTKRCHDLGNSGWYQIIPFYGLWMLFGDGEVGDNEYGSNPKGINRIN